MAPAKKIAAPSVAVPAASASVSAPVAEPVSEAPAADGAVPAGTQQESPLDVTVRLTDALDKVQSVMTSAKELLVVLKGLQKSVGKLQAAAAKEGKKAARRAANASATPRRASGFAKPTTLSKEMCDFLGVAPDTMMARIDVTRALNAYIRSNNLQDPSDKRKIRLDDKLKTIITTLKDGEQLTFFKLQAHINRHFAKAGAVAGAAAPAQV